MTRRYNQEDYEDIEPHFEKLRKKIVHNPVIWGLFLLTVISMGAFYIIDLFRGSDIVVSSNQNDSKIIYYYSSPDPVPINSIHIKCKIISNNKEKPSLFAKMDFYGQPVNLYIYENVKFRITIGKNNYVLPFVVNRKNELSYLLRVPEDISNAKFATKVVMETSIYKSVYIKVPIREKTIDVPPVIYYY